MASLSIPRSLPHESPRNPSRLRSLGVTYALLALGIALCAAVAVSVPGPLSPGAIPMPPDGRPLSLWLLAGSGRALQSGEVAVTYLDHGQLSVERVTGVQRIERYFLKGRLEQVVLYVSPLHGIVFNQPFVTSYRTGAGIPDSEVTDQFFNHYDPELGAVKLDMRQAAVTQAYQTLLGRDPQDDELMAGLHDLTRGVDPDELEKRLSQSGAAAGAALARRGLGGLTWPWTWLQWQRRIAQVRAGDRPLADVLAR